LQTGRLRYNYLHAFLMFPLLNLGEGQQGEVNSKFLIPNFLVGDAIIREASASHYWQQKLLKSVHYELENS